MRIALIAATKVDRTNMEIESGGRWGVKDGDDDASALSEFAGRQCYESWSRPNPATATNAGYLAHIMDEMHTSVLEHGSVSVRVSHVSRSLTHELVRHRHGSYSQLSQRFVKAKRGEADAFVMHPFWDGDPQAGLILSAAWDRAVNDYDALYAHAEQRLADRGVDARKARKMAAEAARMVLPNMTPTAIVVTGNHLYWRHFLNKRGGVDADAEIRQMARYMHAILSDLEPNLYQDFNVFERQIGRDTVATVELSDV